MSRGSRTLTRKGFYNGLTFHRVIDGFMAQGGDPQGRRHRRLDASRPQCRVQRPAARPRRASRRWRRRRQARPNSANSQFYIMLAPRLALDGSYTVFGRVVSGMNFVDAIEKGEPPASPSRSCRPRSAPTTRPPPAPRPGDRGWRRRSRRRRPAPSGRAAGPAVPPPPSIRLPGVEAEAAAATKRAVSRRCASTLFDFALPPDRIALRPASPRDARAAARRCAGDALEDRGVARPAAPAPRAATSWSSTTPASSPPSSKGRRGRGADRRHPAQARGAARLARLRPQRQAGARGRPDRFRRGRRRRRRREGQRTAAFLLSFEGEEPVELLLERAGRMPLPPYIAGRRAADARDAEDYQTMFAREEGAVAAPTAALHFTPRLMAALAEAGIGHETLTLHVGAGTFLPVKAEDTADHRHARRMGPDRRRDRRRASTPRGPRAAASSPVGTTSLRLLESAADEAGAVRPFEGDTAIFITPGYRFRAVDGLITNFHLPRSTLFMLVSALMGLETMQARLCACDRARATASTPTAMRACCCPTAPGVSRRASPTSVAAVGSRLPRLAPSRNRPQFGGIAGRTGVRRRQHRAATIASAHSAAWRAAAMIGMGANSADLGVARAAARARATSRPSR